MCSILPDDGKKLILEVYNAVDSDSFDGTHSENNDRSNLTVNTIEDTDKDQYVRIGRTEIPIDKILQNLLVFDEWTTTRQIVLLPEDYATREDGTPAMQIEEDLFSSHSQLRSPNLESERGLLQIYGGLQNKGTLHLSFKADLTEAFIHRVEAKKLEYLADNREKLEFVS
jgi:hypothetical protein